MHNIDIVAPICYYKNMKSIISLITPKKGTNYLIEGTTLRNAIERFKAHKFSAVPIIDKEGRYLRTISEGDFLRYITNLANYSMELAEKIPLDVVESYRPYKALSIDASIIEVISLSLEQNFIPLVDDRGLYIGIIKRKEILEFLVENRDLLPKEE